MKKYDIYFTGSNRSFVSSILLYSLIIFTKKNTRFNVKYIINTDLFFSFNQNNFFYKLKNKIKYIIYFFFNKKYFYIEKLINKEFDEKKCIIDQAKNSNIKYAQFSNFNEKIDKKSSILINGGWIKIFKKKFLNKFNICINYHNAELPRFRGSNSNSFSLFYNKLNTYFSLHYINSKIDRGYVFYKHKIKINKKIKHNLFYEILKIKTASKNIEKIITKSFKKRKNKFSSLKKGGYYPLKYYENFFLKINQFSFKEIIKYIDIFGGIYYMGNFVTSIKKSDTGILLKDCKIKITQIKYFPVYIYKLLIFLSLIKP